MSEETNHKEFSIPTNRNTQHELKIAIDNNAEIERKDAEIKDLNAKLTKIVSIEFAKQCQQYGIDPSTSSPDDLKSVKEAYKQMPKSAPKGGTTAHLSAEEAGFTVSAVDSNIDINWLSAESPEALIHIATERAKKGDTESQKVLNKLTRKLVKHGFEFEFQGNTKDFLRSPKHINDMDSEETKRLKQEFNSKLAANRCQWKEID